MKVMEEKKMNNLDKVYAESIAKDYMPKETSKVRQLKKLDDKAKKPAFITALSVGIVGALILGTGMCFSMGVLGSGIAAMVFGIILGIIGIAICIINYPLYLKLLKKGKSMYAYEIIELAKEIAEE